jgi:hypothetical protein
MKNNTRKHTIDVVSVAALITTLISTAAVADDLSPDPKANLNRLQIGLGVGGQFSSVDLTDVPPGFDDTSDDGAGVNFAISLGYRLNQRTTLVSALHYVHQENVSDAMRGIGMLGVGVRHSIDQEVDGWYVDGLIGGTFVTQSFDDADELDDDNFATGKGLRLAVGRSVGKNLRLEGALLALEADGGALPSGVDIEAASTQLQLTWDIR